jgi:hypothetical protein
MNYVIASGYVEQDNDCKFGLDSKSTRSRESIDPKTDLGFYFNTYIIPKYGLSNINVSNCASFMKDLEMNWTKLTPDLKDKVLDIMVVILNENNYDFKNSLLNKLGVNQQQVLEQPPVQKTSRESFGSSKTNIFFMVLLVLILVFFMKPLFF